MSGTNTSEDSSGISGEFPCAFLIQQCLRSISTDQVHRAAVTSRRISTARRSLHALTGLYSQKLPNPVVRDDIKVSLRVQLRHARVDLQEQLFRHRYLCTFLQEIRDTRPEPATNWQAFRHYNYFIFRNFLTPDPSVNSEKLPPLFVKNLRDVINALTVEDKTQFYVRIVALLREYVDIAVANFVGYVPTFEESRVSSYLACLLSYYSAFISATLKLSDILAEFNQFINERFHVNWYLFNQRIFYQYFYQRPEVQQKLPAFLEMYNDQQQPGIINLLRSYTLFVENMNRLDTHWEIQRKRIDILNERNMRTENEWLERDWKMFEEMRRITKTNYWFARTEKEMAIQDMEELDSQLLELLSSIWLTGERIITLAGTCVCEDCLSVEFFQTIIPPNHRLRNNSTSTGIQQGNSALYEVPVTVKEVWTTRYERPIVRLMMCSLCHESVLLSAYSNHIASKHSMPLIEKKSAKHKKKSSIVNKEAVNEASTSGKTVLESRTSLLLLEKSNYVTLPVNSPHVMRYAIGNNANRLLQFKLPPSLASSVRALHGMSKSARYIEHTLDRQKNDSLAKRTQSHNKPFSIHPELHNHIPTEACVLCMRGGKQIRDAHYVSRLHCLRCCDVTKPSTITIFPTHSDNISLSNSSATLRPYATLTSSSSSASSCCSGSDMDDFCKRQDNAGSSDSEVIVVLKNQSDSAHAHSAYSSVHVSNASVSANANAVVSNHVFTEAAGGNHSNSVSVLSNSAQIAVVKVSDAGEGSSCNGLDDKTDKPARGPKRHLPDDIAAGDADDLNSAIFVDIELEPDPPTPFAPDGYEDIPGSYTEEVLSTFDDDLSGVVLIPILNEEYVYEYLPQMQQAALELNLCAPVVRLDVNRPAPGFLLANHIAEQLRSYERGRDPPKLFVDADEEPNQTVPQYPNQDSIQHSDGLDDCSRLFQAFLQDATYTFELVERTVHSQHEQSATNATVEDFAVFEDVSAAACSTAATEPPLTDDISKVEQDVQQLDDLEFDIPDFVPGDDFPQDLQDCLSIIERLKQRYMIEDSLPPLQELFSPTLSQNIREHELFDAADLADIDRASGGNVHTIDVCSSTPCSIYPDCMCANLNDLSAIAANRFNWMEMMKQQGTDSAGEDKKVFIFTAKKCSDDETNLMPPPATPTQPAVPCFQPVVPVVPDALSKKRTYCESLAPNPFADIPVAPPPPTINPSIEPVTVPSRGEVESLANKLKKMYINGGSERRNAEVNTAEGIDTLRGSQANKPEPARKPVVTSATGAIPKTSSDRFKRRHLHYRSGDGQTVTDELDGGQQFGPVRQIQARARYERLKQRIYKFGLDNDSDDDDDDDDDDNDNEIVTNALTNIPRAAQKSRCPSVQPPNNEKDTQKQAAKALKKQRQKERRMEERLNKEAIINAEKERIRIAQEEKRIQLEIEVAKLKKERYEQEKREEQRKQRKAKEAAKKAAQQAELQRELDKRQEQSRKDKAKKLAKKGNQTSGKNGKKEKAAAVAAPSKAPAKCSNNSDKSAKDGNLAQMNVKGAPARNMQSIDDDASSYEPWSSDEFDNSEDPEKILLDDKSDSDDDQPKITQRQQEVTEELPAMIRIKRVGGGAPSAPTVTISLKGETPEQDKLLYTLINGQAELAEPPPQLTAAATALLPMPDLSVLDDPSLTKKQRKKKSQKLAKQVAKVTAANAVLQPEGGSSSQQSADQSDLSRELKITLAVDKNLRTVRAGGEPVNTISNQQEESQSITPEIDTSNFINLPNNFTLPPGITITKVKQQPLDNKPPPTKAPNNYTHKISTASPYSGTITPMSSASYGHDSVRAVQQHQDYSSSYNSGNNSYYYHHQHQQNAYQSGLNSQHQSPSKPPYVPFYVNQPKSGSLIVVDTEKLIKQGAVKKRKTKKNSAVAADGAVKPKKYRRPQQKPPQLSAVAQSNNPDEELAIVIEPTPSQQNVATSPNEAVSPKMITLKNPLFNQQASQPVVQKIVDAQKPFEQVQQDQLSAQATISKGENGMVTIRRPGLSSADKTGDTMSMQDFLREQKPATDWNAYSLFSNPAPAFLTSITSRTDTAGMPTLDLSDARPVEMADCSVNSLKNKGDFDKSLYQANDVRSSADHPWKELLSNLPPEVEVTTLPSRCTFQPALSADPDDFSEYRTENAAPSSGCYNGTSCDTIVHPLTQFPAHVLERSALNIPDVTLFNSSGLGMRLDDVMPEFGTDTRALERAMSLIQIGGPHAVAPPNLRYQNPGLYGHESANMAVPNQMPPYQGNAMNPDNVNSDVPNWGFENVFDPKESLDGELDAIERDVEAFKLFCQQSIPPERKEKVAHLNVKDIVFKKKNRK